jgi:hypothetical protein
MKKKYKNTLAAFYAYIIVQFRFTPSKNTHFIKLLKYTTVEKIF